MRSEGVLYVAEDDFRERSTCTHPSESSSMSDPGQVLTTTGVVDNLLHDASNVAIALGLCQLALHSWSFRDRNRAGDVRSRGCGTGRGPCSSGCWR